MKNYSLSRRSVLRGTVAGTAGVMASTALFACGETKTVEKIVEVEKVVEKIVEVPATPQKRTVKIEHATDHTSGPRGKAMSWALDKFHSQRPDVRVKFIPQDHVTTRKLPLRQFRARYPSRTC